MSDYSWVDTGLAQLGFALDLSPKDLPIPCRPAQNEPISVRGLMSTLDEIIGKELLSVMSIKNAQDKWSAEIGSLPGAPVVTQRTIVDGLSKVDREDYLKLFVDDTMTEVAKAWDSTFREGSFEYIITNDGKAFKNGAESIQGLPSQNVAKIMRWIFEAPGFAKREIVSVYVTRTTEDSILTVYFPVRGDKLPVQQPGTGLVRGRLMVPCFDRAVFHGDGTSRLEHYATAVMNGWMPSFIMNTYFAKKKMLDGAREEAKHFVELLSKKGAAGGKFASIQRRDQTTTTM